MIAISRRGALVGLCGFLASCATGSKPSTAGPSASSVTTAHSCGQRPTSRTSTGGGRYSPGRVGQLEFRPDYYRAGYPTKVLVVVDASLNRPLTLTGERCGSSEALRFLYTADPSAVFPTLPVRPADLSRAGTTAVQIDHGPLELAGYMLFTSIGEWRVWVASELGPVGSLGIVVQ